MRGEAAKSLHARKRHRLKSTRVEMAVLKTPTSWQNRGAHLWYVILARIVIQCED